MKVVDWWRLRRARQLNPVRSAVMRLLHDADPHSLPYATLLAWLPYPRLRVRAALVALRRDGFVCSEVSDTRRYRLTDGARELRPPRPRT